MRGVQLSTFGRGTPQPPGRTPHRSALRLPSGEALLPGGNPRTPVPPEASAVLACAPPARRPAREAMI
jgi:hypothetical protein